MYNAGPFNPYIAQRNYFQYDYAAQGYMDSKTEIVQNRSTENDPFVNFMRYDVSFNYREKESHRLTRNWVNGAWQNMNQVSFVYPNVYGDSVCTAEVVQLWDVGTGSWVNSGNTAYSYNNFDYPTQYTEASSSTWVAAQNSWLFSTRNLYSYNSLGHTTVYEWQSYDTDNMVWKNGSRMTYDYTANGLVDTTWIENAAFNAPYAYSITSRMISEYDGDNQLIVNTTQIVSGGNWENGSRYLYTYDANGNLLTAVQEVWDNGINNYVAQSRQTYSYDTDNNQVSMQVDNWNVSNAVWVNGYRYEREFDEHGNRVHYEAYSWVNNSWVYTAGQDDFFDCGELSFSESSMAKFDVYPNPVNNVLHVKTTEPHVFSLKTLGGQEIFKFTSKQINGIDVTMLTAGMYLLQNEAGQSMKFIKE